MLGSQQCKTNTCKLRAGKKPQQWKPVDFLVEWDCDFFNSLKNLANYIIVFKSRRNILEHTIIQIYNRKIAFKD